MQEAARGAWSNPPLAYVVAELVISPHYSLAAYIAAIQQGFRAQYPRTLEGAELTFDANSAPVPQQQWRLLSVDQSRGVQISPRAISFHTTRYTDSKEFLNALNAILYVIQQSELNPFIERVGLRYCDMIVPSEGHEPGDYVLAGSPISLDGAKLQNNIWAATYRLDDVTINARIGAPSPEGMVIPPALNPLPLKKPDAWLKAEQLARDKATVGFIDTDCMKTVENTFVPAEISAHFELLRDIGGKTFRSLLSPLAKREWE